MWLTGKVFDLSIEDVAIINTMRQGENKQLAPVEAVERFYVEGMENNKKIVSLILGDIAKYEEKTK